MNYSLTLTSVSGVWQHCPLLSKKSLSRGNTPYLKPHTERMNKVSEVRQDHLWALNVVLFACLTGLNLARKSSRMLAFLMASCKKEKVAARWGRGVASVREGFKEEPEGPDSRGVR